MARRGIPKGSVNWFIREWMDMLGKSQSDMTRLAGWSKATASQLYNGAQDYSPKVVNSAAVALNCRPWELLMHPDEAMAIRRLRVAALQIAADSAQPVKLLTHHDASVPGSREAS
jgi:transcriptional regulator with XRE-family HTH domain